MTTMHLPLGLPQVDTGDTAWVIVCTALVLLMTPGLALFYAGMVRSKHALGMIMQNFVTMAVVTVTWVVVGYSLAFVMFQLMFAIATAALIPVASSSGCRTAR